MSLDNPSTRPIKVMEKKKKGNPTYRIFLIPKVFATFPANGNVINIPVGVPISPNASWDLSRFRPDWTSGIRASQTPNTTGWIKKIPIT